MQPLAIALAVLLVVCTSFELANTVMAQTTGYRFGPNGIVFQGQNGGVCFEPVFLYGVDSCLNRIQTGNIGFNLGTPNSGWAYMPNAPVVALSTATTGGSIPNGTSYRLALTYMTITGGETAITSTQEATQTTTGSGTSTITATAPIAAAGAAGYRIWSTNASGVGNGNATLTELLQPITTTVCAGAFQVNGPAGPGTGPWVCPIGTNAVLTSITTTAATVFTPNIPGSGPTVQNGGIAIPAANTAAYPAAIPELIANLNATTALATITSAQTFASIPLAANVQNSAGKVIRITGHGVFTTSNAGTITLAVTEGGITPISVAGSANTAASETGAQFSFDYYITTASTGTAGTLESHGQFCDQLSGTLSTAMVCTNDQNTAVSASIGLTTANTLAITFAVSGSGFSSATLRDAQVWLLN